MSLLRKIAPSYQPIRGQTICSWPFSFFRTSANLLVFFLRVPLGFLSYLSCFELVIEFKYRDKSGQAVTAMLATGTNVNVCDNKNKSTPLHLAVNQGNEAGVRALLLSRHCDVNCQVSRLHYAGFHLKCIYIDKTSY